MANLKADLLNELRNQKYYSEMELLRLAQDPSMNYKQKISKIIEELEKIAGLNNKLALAEAYFQAPEQQVDPNAPQVTPEAPVDVPQAPVDELPEQVKADVPPVNQPLPGQSHGE